MSQINPGLFVGALSEKPIRDDNAAPVGSENVLTKLK